MPVTPRLTPERLDADSISGPSGQLQLSELCSPDALDRGGSRSGRFVNRRLWRRFG